MIGLAASLAAMAVVIAATLSAMTAGFRAGDRPEDATVTAVMGSVAQPDGRWPVVMATVHNPGAAPVLVGLSVRRRLPDLLSAGVSVTVPRRSTRHQLRADRQTLVGVVAVGKTAQWAVPLAAPFRSCRLVAVIGQADRRLRVIGVPVTAARSSPVARGLSGRRAVTGSRTSRGRRAGTRPAA